MTEVYVLIDLTDDNIEGIYTTKEKLIKSYKLDRQEEIDRYKYCILKYPKDKEIYEKEIEEIQTVLDVSNDDLFELILDQDKVMSEEIKKIIRFTGIHKIILDAHC